MNIAVNTRLLKKNKLEGIGWFTYETLIRITKEHPEHTFYFLFDSNYSKEFIFSKNVIPVVLFPPAKHPVLFKIWFNLSVTRFLKKHKIDLFLSPDGYLSLKTKTPQIAVIHDLNFEHYPQFLPPHILKYYKTYFPLFAKKAEHIITVSHYSKKDIIEQYNIEENKITVAHNGVNTIFSPVNEEKKQQIRKKYTNDNPFFIYVGSLNKRKNIANTLKAFDKFKQQTAQPHKFVIIGEKLFQDNDFYKIYNTMNFKDDVLFLGRTYNEELKNLLASAEALLYISYFEGFGIPLVEAMKCGTPVITSTETSLPEIGGNAALYSSPDDIDAITSNMIKTLTPKIKQYMINKGLERAKHFSWDKTSKTVWSVIEQTLNMNLFKVK